MRAAQWRAFPIQEHFRRLKILFIYFLIGLIIVYFFLCQTYLNIERDIRKLFSNIFIFKVSIQELNLIFEEHIELNKEQTTTIRKFVFDKPYNFLFMNTDLSRLFKNFDESTCFFNHNAFVDLNPINFFFFVFLLKRTLTISMRTGRGRSTTTLTHFAWTNSNHKQNSQFCRIPSLTQYKRQANNRIPIWTRPKPMHPNCSLGSNSQFYSFLLEKKSL